MITSFYNVFRAKLEKQLARIENELNKPKKDRNKDFLKEELKRIKKTKKLLKEMAKTETEEIICPHCNKSFDMDHLNEKH